MSDTSGAAAPLVSQNVQMWADWYTILIAPNVYHTHSDFSISAIHWMNNLNSSSIVGYNHSSGVLETTRESWIVDGETVPLSERSLAATGTSQLRSCRSAALSSSTSSPKGAPTKKQVERETDSDDLLELERAANGRKFVLFQGLLPGQGTGNIISGLLAAHLLGEEFNRTVCVLPTYVDFLEAFEPIGQEAVSECPKILTFDPPETNFNAITLVNYAGPANECALKDKLASDETVLFLICNTYPRWPVVPDGFFLRHYRPRQQLLDALPYSPETPPTIVVHLREPDDIHDHRRGLDDASLDALGASLPKGKETYLVTNRVAFYERFAACCGWSHPRWDTIRHSALGIDWGNVANQSGVSVNQNLRMWADWYTILMAATVYHTHSDFSISAIHWMNKRNSRSIVGLDASSGKLETTRESYIVDGETIPLSQRTLEANGTAQLRWCESRYDWVDERVHKQYLEQRRREIESHKFLLFDAMTEGQGIGNIVSALLSAHLLGQEFDRTVCVRPSFDSFLEVFEAVGANAVERCSRILRHAPEQSPGNTISLVNFVDPPNECWLKEKLQSNEKILFISGNTYPRWPKVPGWFFTDHYRAKQVLIDALPYNPKHPPSTVVHLREPDNMADIRDGLDDATLLALGDALPKGADTYLVTNRVAFFQRFANCCQWSHPKWKKVTHSALQVDWGSLSDADGPPVSQNVQMWADWYTIAMAKTVYHTHSDFSQSAIHWMDIQDSHIIVGAPDGKLVTVGESWRVDGETAPLSERTLEASGTSRLRLCTDR
jgi:hypothetical protein